MGASKVPRYYRLRSDDGSFEDPVAGEVPDGVEATCEGVVWMQLPGERMAKRLELWSEVGSEGSPMATYSSTQPVETEHVGTTLTEASDSE